MKVLVVDDSVGTLTSTVTYLKIKGFEAVAAESGAAAVAAFERQRPAAVVLDLGLPDMDGFAVLDRLCAIPGTSDTIFLAVSGRDDAETLRRIRGSAFAELLVKPVALERLVQAVRSGAPGG